MSLDPSRCTLPCPSESTANQYNEAINRMARRRLKPEQIGARNRSTYNLHRAALVYLSINQLFMLWEEFSNLSVELSCKKAHAILNRIEACLSILKRYPPADRKSPSIWKRPAGGASRRGKRRGLSTLPADWRLTMVSATDDKHEYNAALLIEALTGVRPAELKKGVLVEAVRGGISVTIKGAKVTKTAGQPLRRLNFDDGSPLVKEVLHKLNCSKKQEMIVSIEDPRKFSDYVRALSRRLFPKIKYTASPYSFRHAFSADQKASGRSPDSLAKMLGHISERSQRGYGTTRQGARALANIISVIASRTIRYVPDPSRPWRDKNCDPDHKPPVHSARESLS